MAVVSSRADFATLRTKRQTSLTEIVTDKSPKKRPQARDYAIISFFYTNYRPTCSEFGAPKFFGQAVLTGLRT